MNTPSWLLDRRAPYLGVLAVTLVVQTINVFQVHAERAAAGIRDSIWIPAAEEISSGVAILLLLPFVAWMVRRFPLQPPFRGASLLAHAGATAPFCVAHVALMVAMRNAIWAANGGYYGFQPLTDGLFYEYSKDIFTYAFLAGLFAVSHFLRTNAGRERERAENRRRGAIAVKTPKGAVLLSFARIAHVEASGNYVTLHAEGGEFLHRATMKEMEQLLPSDTFARTHRSHIVRLDRVRAIRSTGDGDKTVELADGSRVPLTRRYARARDWTLPL